MSDEDKIEKHRKFLRSRQRASDNGMSYPLVRTAKEITRGDDPKEDTQRRGIWDEPVVLSLRDYRKNRSK